MLLFKRRNFCFALDFVRLGFEKLNAFDEDNYLMDLVI